MRLKLEEYRERRLSKSRMMVVGLEPWDPNSRNCRATRLLKAVHCSAVDAAELNSCREARAGRRMWQKWRASDRAKAKKEDINFFFLFFFFKDLRRPSASPG